MHDLLAQVQTSVPMELGTTLPRQTGKGVLLYGTVDQQPVIAKVATTADPYWQERFRHECHIYRLIDRVPPPTRVPALVGTNDDNVLVIRAVDGAPLAPMRYPSEPLAPSVLDQALTTLERFADWRVDELPVMFDYPARLAKYRDQYRILDASLTHYMKQCWPSTKRRSSQSTATLCFQICSGLTPASLP